MLIKNTTILLIFLLQSVLMVAQSSRFKDDETIHVWASSGLNMRSKPDAKAEKIATIPYGAKVVVLPNIGVKIPFEVEEFKGFVVKGYWLLVKYENTEGFVFDGFLSRLPAPIFNKNEDKGLEEYFDKYIGKIGGKYDLRFYDNKVDSLRNVRPDEKFDIDSHDGVNFRQKYKNGISLSFSTGEGGGGYEIQMPNSTLFEGYFLMKLFYYNLTDDILLFDKKDNAIKVYPKEEGAGCYYDVKKVGNKIVIDGWCGC
jgi:hypothetical protein